MSAGGSFLPQTDAAMSQSFPAGANKPLLHLCQVFVCPFHALLSPLKVIFPSIIHFFSPRKKNSIIFPSSLPALYPNSPFLRRYQPKAVPQGELSQRRLRRIPPPPSFTPATSHSQLRYPDNFYLLSLTPLHSTSPFSPHVRSRAAQHPLFFPFFSPSAPLKIVFPLLLLPFWGDLMFLMGLLPYGAGNTNPKTLPSPHEDAPGTAASPEGAGPAAVSPPRSPASSHPVPPPGTSSLPSARLRAPLSGCCRPPHGPRIAPHAGGDAASAAARPQ